MPVQTNVQLTPNVSRTIEEKLLGYILLGQTKLDCFSIGLIVYEA